MTQGHTDSSLCVLYDIVTEALVMAATHLFLAIHVTISFREEIIELA